MKKTLILAMALISVSLKAELRVHSLFSDGAVLQQGISVPVWGWADPDTKLTGQFADQEKTVNADANGEWKIKLDLLKASKESRTLVISSPQEKLTIKDVVVGEVWFCSGQSNMQYSLQGLSKPANEEKHRPVSSWIKKEMQTAIDPLLRHTKVDRIPSFGLPLKDFNGAWLKCSPKNNSSFTGTGYFFAKELRKELDVPVGLINCALGGTLIEAWMPDAAFRNCSAMQTYYNTNRDQYDTKASLYNAAKEKDTFNKALKSWIEKGRKGKRPLMVKHPRHNARLPGSLYNGMVKAVQPYAIKGVIWYQGEANRSRNTEFYDKNFAALINTRRKEWKQGDFPFYFVQLASIGKPGEVNNWVTIQYKQRRCLIVENTGMAVANDLGEEKDIHPRNKVDVGKRLSLWALNNDYGKEVSSFSGPLYKSCEVKGQKIRVKFSHVDGGFITGIKNGLNPTKKTNEKILGFEISVNGEKWFSAQAQIVSQSQIDVWHKDLLEPLYVRYAWSTNPAKANLYNGAGLPASCFTSEN